MARRFKEIMMHGHETDVEYYELYGERDMMVALADRRVKE